MYRRILTTLNSMKNSFLFRKIISRPQEVSKQDILLTDIDSEELKGNLSAKLKRQMYEPVTENEIHSQQQYGVLYGVHRRGMISLSTGSKNGKKKWIHFLIDPGSPGTFLSTESFTHLNLDPTSNSAHVEINGTYMIVNQSHGSFSQINLLGMDFLTKQNQLIYIFPDEKLKLIKVR